MHSRHVPAIDRRYWCGIIFASIFGTNLGDLYAHSSGMGLIVGLLPLAGLFALDWLAAARDAAARELYYWVAIIIIRTGATNIADYLAFRLRIPGAALVGGLAAAIAVFAWIAAAQRSNGSPPGRADTGRPALGLTGLPYWAAMLAAGVFGTVVGDICSHRFGQGPSALVLTLAFTALLAAAGSRAASRTAVYWCAVAVARTAGTCLGDWLAETGSLHLGLTLSTCLTGAAFVAVLTLWRLGRPASAAPG